MTLLYAEVLERLKKLDEVTLLELLDIHSDELVDAFESKIEEDFDRFHDEVEGL